MIDRLIDRLVEWHIQIKEISIKILDENIRLTSEANRPTKIHMKIAGKSVNRHNSTIKPRKSSDSVEGSVVTAKENMRKAIRASKTLASGSLDIGNISSIKRLRHCSVSKSDFHLQLGWSMHFRKATRFSMSKSRIRLSVWAAFGSLNNSRLTKQEKSENDREIGSARVSVMNLFKNMRNCWPADVVSAGFSARFGCVTGADWVVLGAPPFSYCVKKRWLRGSTRLEWNEKSDIQPLNQSINQSHRQTHRSINQSIVQSIYRVWVTK